MSPQFIATYNLIYIPASEYWTEATYRVSIKYFPDYKYLLQENYCTWNTNIFFQNVTQKNFFTTP
jgi:spore coat polysaccharide biosynthesis protein SpsF (cytidylyltransferase family)